MAMTFADEWFRLHGLCLCGCFQKTSLATITNAKAGRFKGKPCPYARGHTSRVAAPEVPPREDANGCLIFQGAIDDLGYGRRKVPHNRRKSVLAHRFAYEQAFGPLAPEQHLHHRCGNPSCVNLEHLEPVSQRDHNRLHSSRITPEIAQEIRDSAERQIDLAERYGVSPSHISNIRARRTWWDAA